jgi:hypothetical protein
MSLTKDADSIVFDDWDLRNRGMHTRRVPGVRRVINDLEIKLGSE